MQDVTWCICKHIKLKMHSNNHNLFNCTNKQACDRKALACVKIATREMHNLKGEIATN